MTVSVPKAMATLAFALAAALVAPMAAPAAAVAPVVVDRGSTQAGPEDVDGTAGAPEEGVVPSEPVDDPADVSPVSPVSPVGPVVTDDPDHSDPVSPDDLDLDLAPPATGTADDVPSDAADAADGEGLTEGLVEDDLDAGTAADDAAADVDLTASAARGPASRIAAGERHSLYLDDDGQVWAWGANESGQLGNGSTVASALPVRVTMTGSLAGREVVAVAAGLRHSLALDADGRVHTWGSNDRGQLGDGTLVNRTTPVLVAGLLADQRVVQVSGGGRSSFSSSAALGEDGRVYTWGSGERGRLGNGTLTARQTTPVLVGGLIADVRVVEIAVGLRHTVVLGDDGRVFSWGYRIDGSMGDDVATTGVQSTPVAVTMTGALSGVRSVQLAAGLDGSRLLGDDGQVFAWGANPDGRLGTGTTTRSVAPVSTDMAALGALGNRPVQVAAGDAFTLALGDDGRVAAWGQGASGQLGNNATAVSTRAVAVHDSGVMAGARIVEVTAGAQHALALADDGRLFAWGRGVERQLGDGGTATSRVPVPVGGLRVATQPLDVSVPVGTPGTFAAAATGAASTVHWELSTDAGQTWTAIEGATSETYTTPPSTPEMGGQQVRAVFTGESAFPQRVASRVATLTVDGPPAITLHPPETVRAWSGKEVVLAADAVGPGPMSVRWQTSSEKAGPWTDVPGATDRTYTLTVTPDQDGRWFRAVFTNPAGSATTGAARLDLLTIDARLTVTPTARLVTVLREATSEAARSDGR